jgi:hypothetical protein
MLIDPKTVLLTLSPVTDILVAVTGVVAYTLYMLPEITPAERRTAFQPDPDNTGGGRYETNYFYPI